MHSVALFVTKHHSFFAVLAAVILTAATFWLYFPQITAVPNEAQVGTQYAQSQYVMGEGAISKIGDDTLYQYAAYAYMKGEDPTTINFEHPPLGKYFFGITQTVLGNMKFFSVSMFFGVLLVFYFLSVHLGVPKWYGFLAMVYVALFSGINHHLGTTLLDLPILFFTLLFFYLLFTLREGWQKYLWIGIVLGVLTAIKYYFPTMLIFYGVTVLWNFWHKNLRLSMVWLTTILGTYLFSYSVYFTHGHNLLDLLKFEWYRYKWWSGDRDMFSTLILEMLFTGSTPTWWDSGKITRNIDTTWNISWPILFVLSLAASIFLKMNRKILLLIIYSVSLLGLFIISAAPYGRYLFQLIPIWLILIGLVFNKQYVRNFSKTTSH